MNYKKSGNKFIIRLDKGDEIISSIKKFCKKENITGYFFGIGAASAAEITNFDAKKKKYSPRKFSGNLEISSLTGNAAKKGKDIIIHSHIVLGDENYKAYAGHLNFAKINVTCELVFFPLKIKRKPNKQFNLNSIDV